MNSRSWGPGAPASGDAGQRTGDLRDQVRGDGSGGRTLRQGSGRVIIGMASLNLTLLCVVLAVLAGVANGLLVLATIFAATFAWSVGAFSRSFWTD